MSRTEENAPYLMEMLGKLQDEEHSSLQNDIIFEEKESNYLHKSSKSNPLMIYTIINSLFGFLSLNNLKNCRLVCQEWNSAAQIFLRKQSTIHFRLNAFRPETFIAGLRNSLPQLPFSSFKFSSDDDRSTWDISELENFIGAWGNNVKEVHFNNLILKNSGDPETILVNYDVSPLFSNTSKMSSLKIECLRNSGSTSLDIALEKLTVMKNILFESCNILLSDNENATAYARITPLNISLNDVSFKRQGKVIDELFRVNNIIDFSCAINININCKNVIFDMKDQVFNTNQLHLFLDVVDNWEEAKGDVRVLVLCGSPFVQKNRLNIKNLYFMLSEIDLSALPKTIEKLHIAYSDIYCSKPLQLPNLNFLLLDAVFDNSRLLTYFANCPKLNELQLDGDGERKWIFQLNCVPKRLKKLRLRGLKIEFVGDNYILELDTLILEDDHGGSRLFDWENILAKIKPKVLVLYHAKMQIEASDIRKLLLNNKQIEKFLVGSLNADFNCHEANTFAGSSTLSEYNYYHFENTTLRSITRDEFENWIKLDYLDSDFYRM